MIPDRPRRHAIFTAFFAAEVHHALARDDAAVHVAEGPDATGVVGATVWTDSSDPGPDSSAAIAKLVDEDTLDRFSTFGHMLHTDTPAEVYLYLNLCAVDPAHQGRGIGGQLLARQLDQLDRDRRTAYLVASNLASRRLYQRNGFRFGPRSPMTLPDGHTVMYRGLRPPQRLRRSARP
jgi:ribosomal protein S18 acetylase RimI-like enzyme